jgi:hypothetical protein
MAANDLLILLIDGNNLAHYLYSDLAHGQKMSVEFGRRIVSHVSQYARTWAGPVSVELYLDRPPVLEDPLPGSLRLLFAEYPQTADDLLIDRFWYHHYTQHACLVITNDADILQEVQEAGGSSMSVFDFVRRAGQVNPVFRDPQELPQVKPVEPKEEPHHPLSLSTSVYFRIIEDQRIRAVKTKVSQKNSQKRQSDENKTPLFSPVDNLLHEQVPDQSEETLSPDAARLIILQGPLEETNQEETQPEEGPIYLLDLENWPLIEGARFLRSSFCPEHRREYQDLLASVDDQALQPADLRALAELLLFACGEEDNFARRGSLMDRVRLALLLSRGEPLALPELARVIGASSTGLQGRIKQKAGRWLMIF